MHLLNKQYIQATAFGEQFSVFLTSRDISFFKIFPDPELLPQVGGTFRF